MRQLRAGESCQHPVLLHDNSPVAFTTLLCKNFFARGHLQGAPRGHLQGDSGGFRGIPLVPPGTRGHQGDPPESPWPQGAPLAPGGTPGGGLNLN